MSQGSGLSSFVTRRPVAVLVVFLAAGVFGWFSYKRLPLTLMPELSYPTLTVRTEYGGAAPEEVENDISRPIEEALGVVGGLQRLSSISRAGVSDVVLEFAWDTDMGEANQDVLEKLDLVLLPEQAERPLLLQYDPSLDPVMELSLSGEGARFRGEEGLRRLRRLAELQIKRSLEPIKGVAAVRVRGGLEEEIHVQLDAEKLRQTGLSVNDVIARLQQENINVAGGTIKEGRTEYMVRTLNEYRNLEQIGDTLVTSRGGREVRIKDLGRVDYSHKEREILTRTDGGESVQIEILKEADANIVALARRVRDEVGEIDRKSDAELDEEDRKRDELPDFAKKPEKPPSLATELFRNEGVVLQVVADRSTFIESSLKEVRSTALLGGLLAVLVLFLFLRNGRSTAIVALSIPISLLVTFAPLNLFGISLNIMSLGGLALGIGMLVDSSIVVLESIYRCREEGDDLVTAAVRGTAEVRGAVTSSTLTSIAVFFPMVFVEGIAGQAFGALGLAVVVSLLASLAVAVFFIPMLASRQELTSSLTAAEKVSWGGRFGRRFENWVGKVSEGRRQGGLKGFGRALVAALVLPFTAIMMYGEALADLFGAFRKAGGNDLRRWRAWRPGSGATALLRWPLKAVVLLLVLTLLLVRFSLWLTCAMLLPMPLVAALLVVLLVLVLRPMLAGGAGLLLALPVRLTDRLMGFLQRTYPGVLRGALASPVLTLLVVLGILALTAGMVRGLDSELLPEVYQGEFTFEVGLPVGTPLETTVATLTSIEEFARQGEYVEGVITTYGFDPANSQRSDEGEHSARFKVLVERPQPSLAQRLLAPLRGQAGEDIDMRAREQVVIDRLRGRLRQIPDLDARVVRPVLFSFRTPVEVEVHGDRLTALRRYSEEVLELLEDRPELADVETTLRSGAPEVQIVYDREQLTRYGLNIRQVAELVRNRVQGFEATRYNLKDRRIPILVRLDELDRETVADVRGLVVNPGAERPIPLEAVAEISLAEGPSEVRRVDGQRVALVTANLAEASLGGAVSTIQRTLDTGVDWPTDMTYFIAGQSEEWQRSQASLWLALGLSIFLVYVIMAAQFESLVHPLVILFSIPLAFFGTVVALWWLNISLSIVVFLGMIMLAGIVVNNAIVLVDYINTLKRRGLARVEAIVTAGRVRLRPILMSTATTVLGLLPMAIGLGDGAEIRTPMAIAVISGLVASTALTLIIVPVIYALFDGLQERLLGRRQEADGDASADDEALGMEPEGVTP